MTQSQEITSEKQKKVVILDSIKSNAIINIIVKGQVAERKLLIANDRVSQRNNVIKKLQEQEEASCKMLDISEHASAIKDTIIFNDKKIIKREKRKKGFWKYISIGLTGLLILQSVR